MFINFKINYSRAKNIYISKQKVVCMVEKKVNKKSKVIITILSFIFFIILSFQNYAAQPSYGTHNTAQIDDLPNALGNWGSPIAITTQSTALSAFGGAQGEAGIYGSGDYGIEGTAVTASSYAGYFHGNVVITPVGNPSTGGDLTVQNLVSCQAIATDVNGKLSCKTNQVWTGLWSFSNSGNLRISFTFKNKIIAAKK